MRKKNQSQDMNQDQDKNQDHLKKININQNHYKVVFIVYFQENLKKINYGSYCSNIISPSLFTLFFILFSFF